MSFEDTLRSQIQREAGTVPLPDRAPERAAERARQRRNHRRVAVATTAAAAVLAAALPPALSGDGADDDVKAQVPAAAGQGLPATGPLDMAWEETAGGLSNVMPVVQDGDVVYALSSGPGTRMIDYPMGDYPVAVYRLGDDGTWTPAELDGPRVRDIAAADGLLYSIATAPGDGGEIGLQLAASEDGGENWAPQDVALPDPPSDAVEWGADSKLELESDGDTTLAVVATSPTLSFHDLFPQLAGDPGLLVEPREEGLVLIEPHRTGVPPSSEEAEREAEASASGRPTPAPPMTGATVPAPTTTVPATTAPTTPGPTTTVPATTAPTVTAPATGAPTSTVPATTAPTVTAPATGAPTSTVPGTPATSTTTVPATGTTGAPTTTTPDTPASSTTTVPASGEVIDTVPWSELGLDGPEGLDTVYQVFRRDGDGWAAVEGAGDAFAGLGGVELDVAEGRFVASAWDGGDQVVLTSEDGTDWARVAGPGDGTILGVGPALVELPWDGTTGHVSNDGGATWQELDLSAAGIGDGNIFASDAGPLGLAVVLNDPGGVAPTKVAVTGDLRDWTVTPLTDVVGPDPVAMASVFVGEDRVVLSAVDPPTGTDEPPASRTAVGVPRRS